jgi:Mor family transcriptional regulator
MARRTGTASNKACELLAFMADVLTDMVKRCGIEERKASEVAVETMLRMRTEFGGQQLYFPQGVMQRTEEKADEIYDKFMKGSSIDELASEYGHSIHWIYSLIADARYREKAQREAERKAELAKEHERWKREN